MTSNHILSREGYLVDKQNITKKELNELKKELTVVPFDPFEFSKKTDTKFYVLSLVFLLSIYMLNIMLKLFFLHHNVKKLDLHHFFLNDLMTFFL